MSRRMAAFGLLLLLARAAGWAVLPLGPPRAARSAAATRAAPSASPALPRPARTVQHRSSISLTKDWDAILAEEDEDDDAAATAAAVAAGLHVPPDMQYNRRNCERQQRHFNLLRDADPALVRDIYVRDPKSKADATVFWFAGKLARVSDVAPADAARRQWVLIETHAANLRPLDLFGARGYLEIWLAPGDSELDVAYNRPHVVFERVDKEPERARELAAAIPNALVGFVGEVYDPGEAGFRTWRREDGRPARPEITGPAQQPGAGGGNGSDEDEEEYRAPTEKEFNEIQQALKDKDINELWKEQQRRAGKEVDDDGL